MPLSLKMIPLLCLYSIDAYQDRDCNFVFLSSLSLDPTDLPVHSFCYVLPRSRESEYRGGR